MAKVAVIMGSKNDFDAVRPAVDILKSFGVETEVRVISAHRTPDLAHDFAKGAKEAGIEVFICAAGKAAHLGGVIAAYTPLPVIGLPIKSSTMDGLDSLLSMVQMPAGIPVACVAINGALNAGLLAVQILAVKYPELMTKFEKYKADMAEKIRRDDEQLQKEL
ncbi:MAG TPA: 5-(carboxyamino)imidazole ribonucleotide mutase [Candidatus Ornithoclostridium excrementipullorum]|nr:5-(carboxyamino)imidazole ribonucleotide mutase [Candidatus Ornithoclostridium excrementipullorum]